MKAFHPKSVVLTLLSALVLISCWEGSSSTMIAGGGIDGTGIISQGTISAFGSIVVNGTEFDTGNAVIIVDGEEIENSDDSVRENLDIGKVVTVEGRLSEDGSSAIADRVTYNDNVTGPVADITYADDTTKEMVVLGQTVIVNVLTKFKPDTFRFDDIALDDVVEVSGYIDNNGNIRATFLENKNMSSILKYEVAGFVENLNTFLKTFKINDLKVNYTSIADNLPKGMPAEGLFVEVEGTLAGGGEMIATGIELGDELDRENADEFEIMGFVTEVDSALEFTVGNQVVQADENTVFVDGTPGDVAPGVKLEAEGSLIDGVLWADEIEFWKPDQIEVEGIVTEVVSETEFKIGDQLVQTDAETDFEPEGMTLDDVAPGLKLEVKGVPTDIHHRVLVADKVSFEED